MLEELLRNPGGEPQLIAIAGSNGAGKTTFFHSHLADTGLRFVNADELALELDLDPYEAAKAAGAVRAALIRKRVSFVFETVFSDPVGDKVQLLKDAAEAGYRVILVFIRIADSATSIQRVSMRVAQGGHDVPDEKLKARFERTRANLERAIKELPLVLVYDNSRLDQPFDRVAMYANGKRIWE